MLRPGFKKRLAASLLVGKLPILFEGLGQNAQFHQWVEANQPFPVFPDRVDLYQNIQAEIIRDREIDYLEFGVSRGDSILKWAELNTHPASRFVGFDSFWGLPEKWVSLSRTVPAGSYSAGGAIPATADERIRFVQGLFHETLRSFLKGFQPHARIVLHNDSDLYSSTIFVLATLDPVLTSGSIIVFDEFSDPLNEWKAFNEYLMAFGRSCRVLGAAGGWYNQMAVELK